MSIEKITDRIMSEANAEAGKTLEKAESEKQAILSKAKLQAEAIRSEASEKAEKDAILIKERRISVAELETRKLRLAAKQKAIETCFTKTLERLETMEQDAYLNLMLASLLKTGVTGGELLLNPKDRESLGAKLVEQANKAMASNDGAEKLVLSEKTISAKGGFVLRKGAMELNSTLEVMIGDVTEAMTPEVVRILFPKESEQAISS